MRKMMAKVRLAQNAFGWDPETTEPANRPCLCATCKAVVLERIKVERGESDLGRLEELAGKYDKKCQLHPLQACYN